MSARKKKPAAPELPPPTYWIYVQGFASFRVSRADLDRIVTGSTRFVVVRDLNSDRVTTISPEALVAYQEVTV